MLPCPPPGDLPSPGIEPRSPTWWADSLPSEPPGKPQNTGVGSLSLLQWIFLTQELNWDLLHCGHMDTASHVRLFVTPWTVAYQASQSMGFSRQEYWSFSFSIIPSKEIPGLISFRMDLLDLLAVQGTLESSPTPQFKGIYSSALSLLHSPTFTSIHDHWKNHSLDSTDLIWQSNVSAFEYAI